MDRSGRAATIARPAPSRAGRDGWRSAAAWWVRRELGVPAGRLIRITDVRELDRGQAWVAVAGRALVVGLARVSGEGPGAHRHDCGAERYDLLYLCDDGGVRVR